MKIDIHCHTSKYSGCSVQQPEEMIEKAVNRGLDGVIITEHFNLWKKEELKELQEKYPDILILNGVEISVKVSFCSYDILVYGLSPDCNRYFRLIEEAMDYFLSMNCALVLAHPYRFSSDMLIPDKLLKKFHAIEVDSSNFDSKASELSISLAKNLNLPTTIASDSHSTKTAGLWFIETPELSSMSEFVEIIKSGKWKHKFSEE